APPGRAICSGKPARFPSRARAENEIGMHADPPPRAVGKAHPFPGTRRLAAAHRPMTNGRTSEEHDLGEKVASANSVTSVPEPKTRIVVVGGGFGGAHLVRHLERGVCRSLPVEVTLVSKDNFFLMTPFLFEACTGTLELRHCSVPIRAYLRKARFVEATV